MTTSNSITDTSIQGLKNATSATIKFPFQVAIELIEDSTIGSPLPYYGQDAVKVADDRLGEDIVGATVWVGTYTTCDIETRRDSDFKTESFRFRNWKKEAEVARDYDEIRRARGESIQICLSNSK